MPFSIFDLRTTTTSQTKATTSTPLASAHARGPVQATSVSRSCHSNDAGPRDSPEKIKDSEVVSKPKSAGAAPAAVTAESDEVPHPQMPYHWGICSNSKSCFGSCHGSWTVVVVAV
ncbi:uncharacterized protein LOC112567162 isoform X2 [Pomacea canaliculata]|uniref:uncharacterized protein LOC112567162 isoform X2 n=1 Tax=Pomacea canaliculata TaxID=400727 RepID=UPI000D72D1B6|nr:uncharacterized protein LOC112567162 isoform X2 [Pomacea canaliculata]